MSSRTRTDVTPDSHQPRLSDLAYERILESLFERRVPVGAFVSQGELSALIDIPVAPLRDALRVLEAEGILSIHPRSGIQFVRPGLELTRSTYQFRMIIERAAVREFAERGDEALFDRLRQRHDAMVVRIERDGLSGDGAQEMEELETLLHGSVIAALSNPLIEASYRRIHNYIRLLRLERKITSPLALRTLREHLGIIDACRARDADKAEEALQLHFRAASERNLGMI